MTIQTEYVDDVVIVLPKGMLRPDVELEQLEAVLRRVIVAEGHRKVLVNLGQVEWMSSIAIGILASVGVLAQKNEGRLVLCGREQRFGSIFSICCFPQPFKYFGSCEEALESFQGL
jgi:anti-anti-sigma factor